MSQVNTEQLHLIIVPQNEGIAARAQDLFVECARCWIARRGKFFVAISGGHTPKPFFEMLGDSEESQKLPWDKIELFWVDERCVPPDSEESNYKLAADTFLRSVPIPPENVHRIKGEISDARAAAQEYQAEIRQAFGIKLGQVPTFDFVVLGMGADGHTGSLFPDSFAPFETFELATAVYTLDSRHNRVTLTPPLLLAASEIMVLVTGYDKARTLADILTNEPDPVKYPIQSLWQILDRIIWVVDEQAAALLPDSLKKKD
jgi:6-phosphogluconolactonase